MLQREITEGLHALGNLSGREAMLLLAVVLILLVLLLLGDPSVAPWAHTLEPGRH